jgi:hypothetical protein
MDTTTYNVIRTVFYLINRLLLSGLSHLPSTSTPLTGRNLELIKHSGKSQSSAVNSAIASSHSGSILAGTVASSVTMAGTGGGGGCGTAQSMLKPLLPFSVTPPRQNGPSEAERKIEALTKQLEEELEMEEESEYFGKKKFAF